MTEREPVAIGLDLRPIPFDMGDGHVFHLHPEPSSKAEWFALTKFAAHLGKLTTETDPDKAVADLDDFRGAFLPLIAADERDAWLEAEYGGITLALLYKKYVETLTGLPTTP